MSKLKNYYECAEVINDEICGGGLLHIIYKVNNQTITIRHQCTDCKTKWESMIEPCDSEEV